MYCPSSTEFSLFENQHTLYELVKRGGYMTSEGAKHLALRKKSVYMVKEGAVLASNKNLQGDLKDLVPNILEGGNPVWRDGQSIFLRLKQQHNEKR